ncbi:hypothetical protein PoB_001132600 [Plakobranchus ocellatus]|uniref:Uncharacterized protein n=1 Tax=Plakobranchus ocellatus TaxID=259542 RepID=A0AAV3YR24_9GAST|nr:hypothetical protein PoB_001132600 [Plakobranchus ocellatus]
MSTKPVHAPKIHFTYPIITRVKVFLCVGWGGPPVKVVRTANTTIERAVQTGIGHSLPAAGLPGQATAHTATNLATHTHTKHEHTNLHSSGMAERPDQLTDQGVGGDRKVSVDLRSGWIAILSPTPHNYHSLQSALVTSLALSASFPSIHTHPPTASHCPAFALLMFMTGAIAWWKTTRKLTACVTLSMNPKAPLTP